MKSVLLFVVLSVPVLLYSWKSLKAKQSHGFYRFLSWEAMLILLVFNIRFWFRNPFSFPQIVSWIFLLISIGLALPGFYLLKKHGKQAKTRQQNDLHAFEKTTQLVQTGIYRYIRHPMYSSLLFLTWGKFMKNPEWIFMGVAVLASLFLFLTARADENERIGYFGDTYRAYMKKTTRFIPFIF
jgi:protein-S-isoprenylcysteine O-methyltransferase Ste14